jgi:hypothetical protein
MVLRDMRKVNDLGCEVELEEPYSEVQVFRNIRLERENLDFLAPFQVEILSVRPRMSIDLSKCSCM